MPVSCHTPVYLYSIPTLHLTASDMRCSLSVSLMSNMYVYRFIQGIKPGSGLEKRM